MQKGEKKTVMYRCFGCGSGWVTMKTIKKKRFYACMDCEIYGRKFLREVDNGKADAFCIDCGNFRKAFFKGGE